MDELAQNKAENAHRYFQTYRDQIDPSRREFAKAPTTLYIGCVDSRVPPEVLLGVNPGEMMTLRVGGGLVPPAGMGDAAVSGAIEMTLNRLPSVKDVVVCGHTDCVMLAQFADEINSLQEPGLARWLAMSDYIRANASLQADKTTDLPAFKQALLEISVQRSLHSLREIEVVRHKEIRGEITLHGWYYDLSSGALMVFNQETATFSPAMEVSDN